MQEQRMQIVQELHDKASHRSKQETFDQVSWRYQGKCLYDDAIKFINSWEECQPRARNTDLRKSSTYIQPMWTSTVWGRIGVDVIYTPRIADGSGFIVFAWDDNRNKL